MVANATVLIRVNENIFAFLFFFLGGSNSRIRLRGSSPSKVFIGTGKVNSFVKVGIFGKFYRFLPRLTLGVRSRTRQSFENAKFKCFHSEPSGDSSLRRVMNQQLPS